MLYVMASRQTCNIVPRGIVRVEILYSSLVELLVMPCKFFIFNIKKKSSKNVKQPIIGALELSKVFENLDPLS